MTFEGNGEIRFIYDDTVAEVAKEVGPLTIKRASHVEPSGEQWVADMSPVGGPMLGPFKTRSEALADERRWLMDWNIPKPL
jgi:hypothetical protein